MSKPNTPERPNGEHGHLWDMMSHLNERIDGSSATVNERIDKLYIAVLGSAIVILVSVVGTLAAVLLK